MNCVDLATAKWVFLCLATAPFVDFCYPFPRLQCAQTTLNPPPSLSQHTTLHFTIMAELLRSVFSHIASLRKPDDLDVHIATPSASQPRSMFTTTTQSLLSYVLVLNQLLLIEPIVLPNPKDMTLVNLCLQKATRLLSEDSNLQVRTHVHALSWRNYPYQVNRLLNIVKSLYLTSSSCCFNTYAIHNHLATHPLLTYSPTLT